MKSITVLISVTLSMTGCLDVDSPITEEATPELGAAESPTTDLREDSAIHGDPAQPVGFDIERQIEIYDRDGDAFPDITEELMETDPFDPESAPVAPMSAGFPAASCRSGFRQAGSRLCISTYTQNATTYPYAAAACRDQMAHVCTHEDLAYLYFRTSLDASYNPSGAWIGNMASDNVALCGNRTITYNNDPDIYDFEGNCNKVDSRPYWCCHDDDG